MSESWSSEVTSLFCVPGDRFLVPPMSSPVKKRKKPSLKKNTKTQSLVLPQTPESTPNPSLPDDLLISCFARASRLYYPTLSLVSKSFASLLSSPELYKTRSSLDHTESCLYVCLSFHPDPIPRWFTLCRKPDRTLTTNDTIHLKKKKKKTNGYVLAKLPTPPTRCVHRSGLVTVGSDLYNIGGPIDDEASSSVSVLDCRSNTWREGPNMLVKRSYPHANVVDGKIYVAGVSDSDSSSPEWMEVFDPKTQTWELVSSPPAEIRIRHNTISRSAGIDGKVYIFGSCNGLAYDTREGRWESVGMEMSSEWVWFSYCVVEDVFYVYYNNEGFKWYDTKGRLWRVLKGLKGLPKFPRFTARLADYGGKMAVLWGRVVASTGYVDKMIWCAVIALERRSDEEIWGKVEWKEPVLKVPKSCTFECALAATL